MRLTAKQRLRKRIEEAEFVRRIREGTRKIEEIATPCELHSGWRVNIRGRIAPPASECPYCKRDAMRSRSTDRETVLVGHPSFPSTPRLDDRWERFKQEHPERFPLAAGSPEEDEALARIEELRAEETARDAAKRGHGGRFATGRIEHGEWIEFRVPARRGRTGPLGLVRMGP